MRVNDCLVHLCATLWWTGGLLGIYPTFHWMTAGARHQHNSALIGKRGWWIYMNVRKCACWKIWIILCSFFLFSKNQRAGSRWVSSWSPSPQQVSFCLASNQALTCILWPDNSSLFLFLHQAIADVTNNFFSFSGWALQCLKYSWWTFYNYWELVDEFCASDSKSDSVFWWILVIFCRCMTECFNQSLVG